MRPLLPAALATAILALAACGEERSFDAEEFVETMNDQGAQVKLGEELSTTDAGAEIYALRLEEAGSATEPAPADAELHGGGSLKVTESADAAREEYERCEDAVTLICFRAANVAIYFEGITPEEQARVGQAIAALEDE